MTTPRRKSRHKYIFVLGGVMSGIGKGITTASIGRILASKGFRVNLIKVDPYLNVDAGTMNPTEHGEVFVLDSGLETDQDMGSYERFLNTDAVSEDYITSGMVYHSVITRERNLGYHGKCVEAVPDIINEIQERFMHAEERRRSDITVVEIGGTIGDYQNIMFIEAARVMKLQRPDDVSFVLVSYVPMPGKIGELKTRPTRIAAQTLNSYGVQANFIVARSEVPIDLKRREKLAIACNVPSVHIISAPDIESVYEVPLAFERVNLGGLILKNLGLIGRGRDMRTWRQFVRKVLHPRGDVRIAIVGKYFDTGDFVLADSYISVIEAIKASAYAAGRKPILTWINAKDFEKKIRPLRELEKYDGVIVPGGFGSSGVEGKIAAIRYVREHQIPYLGLCYGMQLSVIEYARHVLLWKDAHTTEIDKNTAHPVIDIMPDQKEKLAGKHYGGTMRLGAYPCVLGPGTVAHASYSDPKSYKLQAKSCKLIHERHRHRYEVNPEFIKTLENSGFVFSGRSPDGVLMEIGELPRSAHPFFVGTQFHPEFKARPLAPHPLFSAFVGAALRRQHGNRKEKKGKKK